MGLPPSRAVVVARVSPETLRAVLPYQLTLQEPILSVFGVARWQAHAAVGKYDRYLRPTRLAWLGKTRWLKDRSIVSVSSRRVRSNTFVRAEVRCPLSVPRPSTSRHVITTWVHQTPPKLIAVL